MLIFGLQTRPIRLAWHPSSDGEAVTKAADFPGLGTGRARLGDGWLFNLWNKRTFALYINTQSVGSETAACFLGWYEGLLFVLLPLILTSL